MEIIIHVQLDRQFNIP